MSIESLDLELKQDVFYQAVIDKSNVKGFTHDYYNYPARFSPLFVREAIKKFTNPRDLIIDPFVGGGTTLVEAKLLNRNCIGIDISTLATFISNTKITLLNSKSIDHVNEWACKVIPFLSCRSNTKVQDKKEYPKNLSNKNTWPIRNLIDFLLETLDSSSLSTKQKRFVRCGILKTAQWALDNKKIVPSAGRFRQKLIENIELMGIGALAFYEGSKSSDKDLVSICLNSSSDKIHKLKIVNQQRSPTLILTSPPYPGIHVVYHRWQINGRKETPAPFWIANSMDGHGLSHYTMGNRNEVGLDTYFENILRTFSSIKKICSANTTIVQMLAFSDISWQLPRYLDVMERAGFKEVHLTQDRMWRDVPNRKWYANKNGKTQSSNEVVLIHKLIT
ncbi:MAG: DNA methyltransferase [Chitinophagaceae bacterium]